MLNLINECTVSDAHQMIVKRIVEYGLPLLTEDGEATLELPYPLCVHIDSPLRVPRILPTVGIGPQMMREYSQQMRTVAEDTTFSYTYGNRLLDYNGIDQ